MSELDQLAASIPVDQVAALVGEDPQAVQAALSAALPALLRGLEANAQDPAGARSLLEALPQHDDSLVEGQIDVRQVDTGDGDKIVRHIFGDNREAVTQQLGGVGGSSALVSKLLPILAPIVLSYLAKRMGASGGAAAGGGLLGSILSQVLAGAAQGSGGTSASAGNPMGDVLGDLLGGLLGGGRKA